MITFLVFSIISAVLGSILLIVYGLGMSVLLSAGTNPPLDPKKTPLENQALFAIYLCTTYRYLYKAPNLSTLLGLGLTGTWMIIIILVFIMSLLQAVSACVASGVTCSNVCGNNSTVVVMEQPTALRQEIKIEITFLLVNLPQ